MRAIDLALTADGALTLRTDAAAQRLAGAWIPRHRRAAANEGLGDASKYVRARIIVESLGRSRAAESDLVDTAPPATLTLANVEARVSADRVTLAAPSGICGHIDLGARDARLVVGGAASSLELQGALTLASALLLGRMGRALVHAAAVVDDAGRGWLLVGDSHAGKTTTCATLISAGWRFVADDQVVLSCNASGVVAEGWPREAHLDAGWHAKQVERRRVAADLEALGENRWVREAGVRGALFPNVAAERPTHVERVSPADALTRIVRQSPWLLADGGAAASTLALLTRVASLECGSLSLGRDSYANGEVLLERLSAWATP